MISFEARPLQLGNMTGVETSWQASYHNIAFLANFPFQNHERFPDDDFDMTNPRTLAVNQVDLFGSRRNRLATSVSHMASDLRPSQPPHSTG